MEAQVLAVAEGSNEERHFLGVEPVSVGHR